MSEITDLTTRRLLCPQLRMSMVDMACWEHLLSMLSRRLLHSRIKLSSLERIIDNTMSFTPFFSVFPIPVVSASVSGDWSTMSSLSQLRELMPNTLLNSFAAWMEA